MNPASRAPALKRGPLLVFDVGNVFLRFDMERALRRFDRIDPGAAERLRRARWLRPVARSLERGRISGSELFGMLKRRLGLRLLYSEFRAGFCDIFTPIPRNLRLLERLADVYPTALLSNNNHLHWAHILRTYPLLRRAQWAFSSHSLGYLKPDPRIFHAVARRTAVPLRDMVFVDDLRAHVRTARRLGMRAIHYTGEEPLGLSLAALGVSAGGSRSGTWRKRGSGLS